MEFNHTEYFAGKIDEVRVSGFISDGKTFSRDLLAVLVGGAIMVSGYFLAEAFQLGYGIPAALTEVPGNTIQIAVGAIVGIPVSHVVRRRLPAEFR